MRQTAGYKKLTPPAKMTVMTMQHDYTFTCKRGTEENARRIAEKIRTYIEALFDMGILTGSEDLELYEAMTEEGNVAWQERIER